jgi:hypothetical protein
MSGQHREVEGELMRRDDDDDEVHLVKPEVSALEAISRSEVAMQLDAAHRWPRSVTKFLRTATELATYNEEVAASCIYSVPRDGKMITGKSIRLAEICASAWGNLHVGSRVLDATDHHVIAQSIVWDLERNVRVTIEAQRGILKSNGKRYSEDMIRTTGLAAVSIAMRNAVFRVIPQAYANRVFEDARSTAIGDVKTLVARREKWVPAFFKMGVTPERLFARLEVRGMDDIGLDQIGILIGLATAIRQGDLDIDVAFPPVASAAVVGGSAGTTAPGAPAGASAAAPAQEGRRVAVGTGKRGRVGVPPGASGGEPPAASAAAPPAARPTAPAGAPAPKAATPASSAAPAAAAAPAEPATVDPGALLAALQFVDETWKAAPDGAAIVATWDESERRAAFNWTRAVMENRPMAEQMNRPSFTNIDGPPDDGERVREPGED